MKKVISAFVLSVLCTTAFAANYNQPEDNDVDNNLSSVVNTSVHSSNTNNVLNSNKNENDVTSVGVGIGVGGQGGQGGEGGKSSSLSNSTSGAVANGGKSSSDSNSTSFSKGGEATSSSTTGNLSATTGNVSSTTGNHESSNASSVSVVYKGDERSAASAANVMVTSCQDGASGSGLQGGVSAAFDSAQCVALRQAFVHLELHDRYVAMGNDQEALKHLDLFNKYMEQADRAANVSHPTKLIGGSIVSLLPVALLFVLF